MKIIILGPPGSGKGSQSEIISKKLKIAHISTGNILRREIKAQSEIGRKVALTMKKGDLVDDESIISILIKAIQSEDAKNGFILDGVPRSIKQADSLIKNEVKIQYIIELECDDETILKRITSRRVHPASGRVYNLVSDPPKVAGKDDITGEDLIQREDDFEDVVRNRLHNYNESTKPLHKYYEEMASQDGSMNYHKIEADRAPDVVADEIISLLSTKISS